MSLESEKGKLDGNMATDSALVTVVSNYGMQEVKNEGLVRFTDPDEAT